MASVTGRIAEIKQPRGGYIKPAEFEATFFDDDIILNDDENVHSSIVGMTVDYLTRFSMGTEIEEAFKISLQGAKVAESLGVNNALQIANDFLKRITGLDDDSIIYACKLVTFDVWYRNPVGAMLAKGYNETHPDKPTIDNIRTLINRSIHFFKIYGPIVKDGFTFEPELSDSSAYERMVKTGRGTYGGYTPLVDSGDGDFLTSDTLWDFKVSKSKPTSKHTLQLLMYWIMGQHSGQDVFKKITKLGIFNPRLNTVFIFDMSTVSAELIKTIENEVICYDH